MKTTSSGLVLGQLVGWVYGAGGLGRLGPQAPEALFLQPSIGAPAAGERNFATSLYCNELVWLSHAWRR